ncbi:hypothetical protein [Flindersiella endophytica]
MSISEATVAVLEPGAAMAQGAYVGMMLACTAFPAARFLPANLASEAFLLQTDTGAMGKAAVDLWKSGEEGVKAADVIREQLERIDAETWQSGDQKEFHKSATDLNTRISLTQMVCVITATFTMVIAFLIFAMITVVTVFAAILGALAITYWATRFIPFPPVQAFNMTIFSLGNSISFSCKSFIRAMEVPMNAIQHTGAGIIGALTAMSTGMQMVMGGGLQAGLDLIQGAVSGLDDMARGFAQRAENQFLGGAGMGGKLAGRFPGADAMLQKVGRYAGMSPWGWDSVAQGSPSGTGRLFDPNDGPIPDQEWGNRHSDELGENNPEREKYQ